MSSYPKLSIVSISYNQEKFIKQALESFVTQKTDFDFEIIIADDCSTDKTPEIIKEYTETYPDIFKPILRSRNVGAWKNLLGALRAAKGQYIALCEGDDFWTDPDKLQKQVNFLESNPTYALCFHPVRVFSEDNTQKDTVYPDSNEKIKFTLKELFRRNFIQTNSVIYRRQKYKRMPENILPADWYLHLYHAQFGKIGFINTVMAAYRRHPGGLWWESDKNIDEIWKKYGVEHLKLFMELLKLYGNNIKYRKILHDHINNMIEVLIGTDQKYLTGLVKKALIECSTVIEPFLINQHKRLQDKYQEVGFLKQAIEEKEYQILELKNEIKTIKSSRIWKLRNKIAALAGKPKV